MLDNSKYVVFKLNGELYGLNIIDVGEILKMRKIYKVPGLADNIEGVINIRDKVTTVINLSKTLRFAKSDVDENAKIILMAEGNLGLIVDEVTEIINISSENIESKADLYFIDNSSKISGIAKVNGDIITILSTKNMAVPKVDTTLEDML